MVNNLTPAGKQAKQNAVKEDEYKNLTLAVHNLC